MEKHFILNVLTLVFLAGGALAGCDGSESSKSNSSNTSSTTNSSTYKPSSSTTTTSTTITTASDKQKVINHLNSNGSSDYHFVSTGTYSRLGYDSSTDKFIVAWYQESSLVYSAIYMISFGATSGYGQFKIDYNSSTNFLAYSYLYIANHGFDNLNLDRVDTNLFPSSSNSDLANMMVSTCQTSVNAATTYLLNNSLPYIY